MVLSWYRMKQAQLRALSNQFKRCYFQLHGPSLVIPETRIGAVDSRSLDFHRPGSEFGSYVRFFAAPVQVKPKYEEKDKGRPRMNEQISSQYVRIVTDEGHGVVSRHEALERARRLKVDLVEVQADGNPPVCKLMDYNKEMYIRQAKEKEQAKKKPALVLRKGALKEVRITCKIDKNDLQTKADTVKRLMERGYRVKCMAVGTADQDLGGLLSRLSALIDEFCLVESGPRVEAKQAYIVGRHVKFGPLKKGPGKKKAELAKSSSAQEEEGDSESEEEEEMAIEAEAVDNDDDIMRPETSNRYAASGPPGSDNRYAASASGPPGSGNRYATRRRMSEPESQNTKATPTPTPTPTPTLASGHGSFQDVNRYKKGPTSQQEYHPNRDRGAPGDFSNGIRAGNGFRR